ncbi:hypothetical protein [Caballeronia sp. DA-9]
MLIPQATPHVCTLEKNALSFNQTGSVSSTALRLRNSLVRIASVR